MSLENQEIRINQLESKIKDLETGAKSLGQSLVQTGDVFLSSVKTTVESHSGIMHAQAKAFFDFKIETGLIFKKIIAQLPANEQNQQLVNRIAFFETLSDQTQAALNNSHNSLLDALKKIDGKLQPPPNSPPSNNPSPNDPTPGA